VQSAVVAAIAASDDADGDVKLMALDNCRPAAPSTAYVPAAGTVRTGRQLPAIPQRDLGSNALATGMRTLQQAFKWNTDLSSAWISIAADLEIWSVIQSAAPFIGCEHVSA
jgi:hypothetical protein